MQEVRLAYFACARREPATLENLCWAMRRKQPELRSLNLPEIHAKIIARVLVNCDANSSRSEPPVSYLAVASWDRDDPAIPHTPQQHLTKTQTQNRICQKRPNSALDFPGLG